MLVPVLMLPTMYITYLRKGRTARKYMALWHITSVRVAYEDSWGKRKFIAQCHIAAAFECVGLGSWKLLMSDTQISGLGRFPRSAFWHLWESRSGLGSTQVCMWEHYVELRRNGRGSSNNDWKIVWAMHHNDNYRSIAALLKDSVARVSDLKWA